MIGDKWFNRTDLDTVLEEVAIANQEYVLS